MAEINLPGQEIDRAVKILMDEFSSSAVRRIVKEREASGEDWRLLQHFGLGMEIRNLLRKHGIRWDDVTLDELWLDLFDKAAVNILQPVQAEMPVSPIRQVTPGEDEKFKTALPLFSLKAAAGKFGSGEEVEPETWVEINTSHRLRKGMFVARVEGRSMEPRIPDKSYCLFRSPVVGSRRGRIVLTQHRSIADPETGGSYTLKIYTSEKTKNEGNTWEHTGITLESINPEFGSIRIHPEDAPDLKVIAEFLEVIDPT